MKSPKEEIEMLLRSTNRMGITDLLGYMDEYGFYTAPASTKYHGAEAGALAVHSLNVCYTALEIAKTLNPEITEEQKNSIIICALLHDLGKMGQFGQPLYVENILKKGRSEAQPFKINPDLLTLDHEIVSVIEIQKYIDLTPDEQFAIAYHNALYSDIGRYSLKGNETPLQMIIHFADMWASRVLEADGGVLSE